MDAPGRNVSVRNCWTPPSPVWPGACDRGARVSNPPVRLVWLLEAASIRAALVMYAAAQLHKRGDHEACRQIPGSNLTPRNGNNGRGAQPHANLPTAWRRAIAQKGPAHLLSAPSKS